MDGARLTSALDAHIQMGAASDHWRAEVCDRDLSKLHLPVGGRRSRWRRWADYSRTRARSHCPCTSSQNATTSPSGSE